LHGRIEVEVFPLGSVRTAVLDPGFAEFAGDQVLARGPLRAQPPTVHGAVRVAFDLDDLLVLDEDVLPAPDSAIRAHTACHAIGGRGARLDLVRTARPHGLAATEQILTQELTQHRPRKGSFLLRHGTSSYVLSKPT